MDVFANLNRTKYAARRVYEFLGNPSCHENIVKVGAYVLGEYGHLIADEPVGDAFAQLTHPELTHSP